MDPYSLDHIVLHSSYAINPKKQVEAKGFEPLTLGLQSRCSSQLSYAPGTRTERGEKGTGPGSPFVVGSLTRRMTSCCFALGCEPSGAFLTRKEVIQPHLPVRLPCYDFTPLTRRTLGTAPLAVGLATSGTSDSDGVTGGVYKARERIHRAMLMRDY